MEISKVDLKTAQARPVSAPQPAAPPPAKPAEVKAEFKESAALEQALQQVPAVRPEAVERARQLVGQTDYPPQETLQRIANLLAIKFSSENPQV